MKFDKLGWIVAAGLAGAMVMSGFQGTGMKFASVDVEKIFEGSSLTKDSNQELQTFGAGRMEVIQFLRQNRVVAPADVSTFVNLALKPKRTEQDTAQMQQIQKDAGTLNQKQQDLLVKTSPTADEQKTLSDLHANMQANTATLSQLSQKYDEDIRAEQGKLRQQVLDKVRKTVGEYARKQGYTIVFSVEAAPFAANNLTDEIVKEVSSKG